MEKENEEKKDLNLGFMDFVHASEANDTIMGLTLRTIVDEYNWSLVWARVQALL